MKPITDWCAAVAAAIAAVAAAAVPPSSAQAYPSRTITLVVAYAPGGTGDLVARAVSDKLAAALGQSVVVENRAGAGGALATRSVVAAPADGHTLLVGQTGEISITPHWNKAAGYDPDKDLQPVALATIVPLALVVRGNAPYSSVAEMLKDSELKGLSFASAGAGTPGHFAGEVLKLKTKANLAHVPYKGAGPALNDVLGGHVDFFFSGFPAAAPLVKGGMLKLLAVSTGKRSSIAPEVPTVAEASGIKDFDITLWQGFFAPHGTPKQVVARLNQEINRIILEPDVKAKFVDGGAEVTPMSVDQFEAFVRTEVRKFAAIIKDAGIKAE
ncbi:MAG TPA: tripartite tricarboxylate transporter substrate binding protein [Hyphomicrobiaceae bacterium]|jgi:tripartite-type tricarboxylate transporter receptor subunit TctC|nr:tripartite tricarboxylate transporter substrate binding protein [Hyphomicrobiaceae bacterium]